MKHSLCNQFHTVTHRHLLQTATNQSGNTHFPLETSDCTVFNMTANFQTFANDVMQGTSIIIVTVTKKEIFKEQAAFTQS